MTVLQIIIVTVGLLIIALRGPLIFAPLATRGFYLQLIATPGRVRGMASFLTLLGLVMVAGARGGEDLAAHSRPTAVDGDRLVVTCDSSAWASEFRWLEKQVLDRLAEVTGSDRTSALTVRVESRR